jgi:hypothetical protein
MFAVTPEAKTGAAAFHFGSSYPDLVGIPVSLLLAKPEGLSSDCGGRLKRRDGVFVFAELDHQAKELDRPSPLS